MKHELPSLDALKVFESAARHLSFSRAADELCITKAAVSYHIAKLEAELDCALFRRAVRQVFITEAGQELLRLTQRQFGELKQTLEAIKPIAASHDIQIGATTYVALRWLSPRIAEFSAEHPNISILLQHSVNSADFSIQDVDLAIRWDRLGTVPHRLLLRELPMPLFPVCSPSLLRRQGINHKHRIKPAAFNSPPLNTVPLLCEEQPLGLWQTWFAKEQPLSHPRRIIADANVRTQAAVDGQGWTMADSLMQRELDSGELIAPFTKQLHGYGYVIQSIPGRYVNSSVKLLKDWLMASL